MDLEFRRPRCAVVELGAVLVHDISMDAFHFNIRGD